MNGSIKGIVAFLCLTGSFIPGLASAEVLPVVFWSERGASASFVRSCVVEVNCIPQTLAVVGAGHDLVGDVAVDALGGKVYWSYRGYEIIDGDRHNYAYIDRANLDGTDREVFHSMTPTAWNNPWTDTIEFDAVARKLVWVTQYKVLSVDVDVAATAVIIGKTSTQTPGSGTGLAIDSASDSYYSLVRFPFSAGAGTGWITNGPLTGINTVANVVLRYGDKDLIDGGDFDIFNRAGPFSVTIDNAGDWLFWSDSTNNRILRTALSAPDPLATAVFEGSTPTSQILGVKFDPIDATLYWSEGFSSSPAIFMAPIDAAGNPGTAQAVVPAANTVGTIYNFDVAHLDVDVGPSDPVTDTQTLIDVVGDLTIDPLVDLGTGVGNSLLSELDEALALIETGNNDEALINLRNFIRKVEHWIYKGKMDAVTGQALIDAANAIIDALTP